MTTINNTKLNKKALLEALMKRLKDKGANKKELRELNRRFDGLLAALKEHYSTSLITKVDHNVIVDNLADEFAKLKEISINNWPVQKEFPTKMDVKLEKPEWWKDAPEAVEIKGTVKAEIKDTTGDLLTGIGGMFDLLIKFLKGFTFKTSRADSDYLKPQLVILHDPYTGKALDMHTIMKNAGGGPVSVSVGSSGSGSNTAVYDSLDQYKIADGDEAGTTKYYGFLDKDGNWYILKNDTTLNTYRYTKGSGSYSTNWTNRAALTYGYYDVVF